jgi:hypothetical protein
MGQSISQHRLVYTLQFHKPSGLVFRNVVHVDQKVSFLQKALFDCIDDNYFDPCFLLILVLNCHLRV